MRGRVESFSPFSAECLCTLWVRQMVIRPLRSSFVGFYTFLLVLPLLTQEGKRPYSESSFKSLSSAPGHLVVHLIPPITPSTVPIEWHSGQASSRL